MAFKARSTADLGGFMGDHDNGDRFARRPAALDHAFDGNTGLRQTGRRCRPARRAHPAPRSADTRPRRPRRRPPAPAPSGWRPAGRTPGRRSRARFRQCRRPRREAVGASPAPRPEKKNEPAAPASTTTPLAAPSTLASGERARTMAGCTCWSMPSRRSCRATPSSLMRKPNSEAKPISSRRDVLDAFHCHRWQGRARCRRPGWTAAPACAPCRRRRHPAWDRPRHSPCACASFSTSAKAAAAWLPFR